jgi:hypothetical protein
LPAVDAGAAIEEAVDGHAFPNPNSFHIFSYLDHVAGKFVAQDDWSTLSSKRMRFLGDNHWPFLILVDIRPANATPSDSDLYLSFTYQGLRDFRDAYVLFAMPNRCLHTSS